MLIDANGMAYRELNEQIRQAVSAGEAEIHVKGVNGHRYIGAGLRGDTAITVEGVPGNDLGVFMDGPSIQVLGNGQDGIGNTMNAGRVSISGDARDVVGYAMRGGKILIKGDVGYRVGIHMKSFENHVPIIVVGGTAKDFLGEYLAGGVLVVLGLDVAEGEEVVGDNVAAGMHGGAIYVRGQVAKDKLGAEADAVPLTDGDQKLLADLIDEFQSEFQLNGCMPSPSDFTKLAAVSHRPYGRLYAY